MKVSKNLSLICSFLIVICILVLPFIFNAQKKSQIVNISNAVKANEFNHMANINNVSLNLAFATTEAEREQGLSDTSSLNSNQGMLFFFATSTVPNFWMKDMNYPLDIIWIDNNKKIIGVVQNLSPSTYPQTFAPTSPVSYVLEVSSGFFEKNNLKIGDSINF